MTEEIRLNDVQMAQIVEKLSNGKLHIYYYSDPNKSKLHCVPIMTPVPLTDKDVLDMYLLHSEAPDMTKLSDPVWDNVNDKWIDFEAKTTAQKVGTLEDKTEKIEEATTKLSEHLEKQKTEQVEKDKTEQAEREKVVKALEANTKMLEMVMMSATKVPTTPTETTEGGAQ